MSIEDGKFDVSNPHPDYGKDPNILNEFGHTAYPKWIDHPTDKDATGRFPVRVLVEDEKEEAELLGKRPAKAQSQSAPGWTK